MTEPGLTKAEQKVVDAFHSFFKREGMSPTISELVMESGRKSKADVHRIVEQLIRKGRASRVPRTARSLVITQGCPHCGKPIYPVN